MQQQERMGNNMLDDLISRQAAIDMIEKYFDGLPIAVHHDMLAMIHRLPSAQPEVIRCKDCKYYDPNDHCYLQGAEANDFCSYAERRTDEID